MRFLTRPRSGCLPPMPPDFGRAPPSLLLLLLSSFWRLAWRLWPPFALRFSDPVCSGHGFHPFFPRPETEQESEVGLWTSGSFGYRKTLMSLLLATTLQSASPHLGCGRFLPSKRTMSSLYFSLFCVSCLKIFILFFS